MFIDQPIFTIGDTITTLGSLLLVIAIVIVTIPLGRYFYRIIGRRVNNLHKYDADTYSIYSTIAKYFIWFVGFDASLHILGIHLNTVLAASGFIAVGAGFASRHFIENIISGLILRVERIIKPGDIIVINGRWLIIEKIGVRVTETRSRVEEEFLIPNSQIADSIVENLTRKDRMYQIGIEIVVPYDSDLVLAKKTLEEAVDNLEWKSSEKNSTVYLDKFGHSGMNFQIIVWINDVDNYDSLKADALEALWTALKEKGIIIAPSLKQNSVNNLIEKHE